MKKKFHSTIAWLLAIVMVLTNVNYVHATDTVNDDGKEILSCEEKLNQLKEELNLNSIHDFGITEQSESVNTKDGNDKGTGDGNDKGTGDGADIPTGDHILYSGNLHGIIWYIDKDNVLTITGTNTSDNTEVSIEESVLKVAPWTEYRDYYTKVIVNAKNVKTTFAWFALNDNIEEIDMSAFDTSAVVDMSYMFLGCENLKSLDLSKWNTSKNKNFMATFAGCTIVPSLDVSGLDTSAAEDMNNMFLACESLTSLDVSTFKTSNVKNMNSMFYGCENLTSLKLGNMDTSNVENMYGMFCNCASLTALDVSSFNTQKVQSMIYMFAYCTALKDLDVSKFDTSNVTDMYRMFSSSSSLTYLDVSNFNTSKTEDARYMFEDCTALESIKAFRNLQINIELPVSPMYDDNFNTYEDIFPKGLTESVTLFKNSPMEGKMWVTEVAPQTYTGKAIKPAVKVYDGSTLLKEKVDYTISYKNNTKVNDASNPATAPTIIVKGKGNYTGQETVTFKILPIDLNDEKVIAKNIYTAISTKEQKPVPTVTYKGKKLKNKTDFTVSYPDNSTDAYKAAGTYTIRVKGNGNYVGERDVTFVITNGTLMNKVKVASVPKQTWTGNAIEPELTLTYKGSTLVKGTDYTVTYANNIDAGKATATVTGMGNYAGTKDVTFQIEGINISKADVYGIVNKTYNGEAQTQAFEIYVNDTVLTEKDYDVTYSKNTNAGTASMVITGKGKYSGSIKTKFKIAPYDINKDTEDLVYVSNTFDIIFQNYVKGGVTPNVNIKFNDVSMVNKKDYTLTYKDNKKITKGKSGYVYIKGKGNFTGTYKIPMYIYKKSLAHTVNPITVNVPDVAYSSKPGKFASKPVLYDINGKKLSAGTDYDKNFVYTLEDGTILDKKKDAPAVGTVINVAITGKGNYENTVVASYKITQASFSSAKINIAPQIYTGKAIAVNAEDITVKMNGATLVYGVDYEIVEGTYTNNVKKGTASVTIKGLGNYGGSKTVKFKITSKQFKWFWNLF